MHSHYYYYYYYYYLDIIYYNPRKPVRHVSVLYYGTILRDLYFELHKITNQPVVVHIKG
jgi:hypothetical protein